MFHLEIQHSDCLLSGTVLELRSDWHVKYKSQSISEFFFSSSKSLKTIPLKHVLIKPMAFITKAFSTEIVETSGSIYIYILALTLIFYSAYTWILLLRFESLNQMF